MRILIILFTVLFLFPAAAYARVVSSVQVYQNKEGYAIEVEFYFPTRYQSHAPSGSGQELRVQLRPTDLQQLTSRQIDDLRERTTLAWDQASGIPLQEITMEGGDPEHPQITFSFSKEVEFIEVRNSDNLRKLIVIVRTDVPLPSYFKQALDDIKPPPAFDIQDRALKPLMDQLLASLSDNNFPQSVKLIKSMLESAQGKDRQNLTAWLGYTLEKSDQRRKAKDVYIKYIRDYAGLEDGRWVSKRLDMIHWAEEGLKQEDLIARQLDKWKTHVFGTVSEFFYRDQTTPQGSKNKVNRNEFLTNLDLNHRIHNSRLDVRTQMTGSLKNTLFSRGGENAYVHNLNVEVRHQETSLYTKIGRQFRYSSGVFDIFDGVHAAYDLTPKVTVNTVLGYPVEDTSIKEIDVDRNFQGVSVDMGTFDEHLDFTAYFLTQGNHGYIDRRAIGGEVRFFESDRSVSSLVDYDVFYDRLNVFYVNGWLAVTPETSVNISYDYRNSPSLTTNNALIGQSETELSDLMGRLSKDEVFQLARDRSVVGKSFSGSVTQTLKKDVQLSGGVVVYEAEGAAASGGVDSAEGTGYDLFYFTQLLVYNALKKDDIVIMGLNFDDTSGYHAYGLSVSDQFPITKKLRFTPAVRINFRDYKDNTNIRFGVRPGLRADYRIKKWFRFETEVAAEWVDEKTAGNVSSSVNLYISSGFTITF